MFLRIVTVLAVEDQIRGEYDTTRTFLSSSLGHDTTAVYDSSVKVSIRGELRPVPITDGSVNDNIRAKLCDQATGRLMVNDV
jgi:hypothetical protein